MFCSTRRVPNGHHAHRRLDELQFRQYAELIGELGAADDGVEKRRMGGIHRVFHDLQPVARVEVFLPRHEAIARPDKAVVHGKRRLPVGRPHIGKDDAAVFMGGIGPVIQPVFQGAVSRLARRLEDGPVRRELPPMVAASYPFGVDQPELQRRASMRTMQLQQPYGAAQVSEHHQFLAEDLVPMGQVLQFVRKADRLPKAAQIFAAWRVGADMGQFCIFVRHLAMEITSISRRQVGGSGDHGSPLFTASPASQRRII